MKPAKNLHELTNKEDDGDQPEDRDTSDTNMVKPHREDEATKVEDEITSTMDEPTHKCKLKTQNNSTVVGPSRHHRAMSQKREKAWYSLSMHEHEEVMPC